MRKKCVKFCLSLPLALESKAFVYLKTRDSLSLVSNISFYVKRFYLVRYCCGFYQRGHQKNGEKSYHAEVRLRGCPPQRTVCRTKTLAKQWVQDTEAAIRDGRFKNQSVSRKHTVSDLIDRFAANSIPKHPIYYQKKVQLLNRWKEELGHLLLSELSPAHVAMVRDKLLSETTFKKAVRSSSTVNRYLAAFSKVLSVAVKEWGWLEENPILKISKPKESRGRDRFLTQEEVHRL